MNEAFFKSLHDQFGPLSQSQVDGFNVLLTATHPLSEEYTAYILATAWHETAATMQPIEEYGKGAGHPYPPYYGRGYVQLTWDYNYKKVGSILGVDLFNRPESALEPTIAARIIVHGMLEGWFTGKKLSDYNDYISMRRIINGTDKAALIAGYAHKFETALAAGPLEAPQTASTAPPVGQAPLAPPIHPSSVRPVQVEVGARPIDTQPPYHTAPIGLLQAIIEIIQLFFKAKVKK